MYATVWLLVFISSVSAVSAGVLSYGNPFHLAFSEVVSGSNTNASTCHRHIQNTLRNITSEWALQMLDATSKIPSGIRSGNIADLGAFDQCLAVDNNVIEDRITGKYCKLSVPLENIISVPEVLENYYQFINDGPQTRGAMNMNKATPFMNFALCVPSSCDISDLNKMFESNTLLRKLKLKAKTCQTNEVEDFSTGDWIAVSFFLLIGSLMLFCTVYDLILYYTDRKPAHILLVAFSIYTNGKKLFTISHNPNQLLCLNGIRVISMFWVIVGHTYYTGFFSPTINTAYISTWMRKVSSMYILGATVSVDSFFLLAGLLLSYLFLSSIAKGIKFSLITFYIHRYIRLTPSLGAMILLHVTLLRFFGSGPNWPDVMNSLESPCKQYWWSSLLYIQNFVNPNELCIGQTWYLSVDTQLYFLSPLALIPLSRWPKRTLQVLGLAVIISMAVPFTVAWTERIPALMTFSMKVLTFGEHYYYSTYSRFGPTVVGIIFGYFIYNRKENRRLNALLNNIFFRLGAWIIAIAVLALIVFQPNNMFWHEYDQTESSVYLGVHRVVWSATLGCIIYACVQGHGGMINGFLSLPFFQIISRISYSMYLIHLSFLTMKIGYLRVPIYFSDFQNMYNFWGDCVITMILSAIWSLAFESPVLIIEKVIFKSEPQVKKHNLTVATA